MANEDLLLINNGRPKRKSSESVDITFQRVEVSTAPATANDVTRKQDLDSHSSQHNPGGSDPVATAAPSTALSTSTSNAVGVAASLARSDHSHKVNITNTGSFFGTSTSTTSTTYVLINGMSNTPPAGEYLVFFQSSLQLSANNSKGEITIFAGGVAVTGASLVFERSIQSITVPSSLVGIPVSVNGSQTIEVMWRVNTGTLTALDSRLFRLLKVG